MAGDPGQGDGKGDLGPARGDRGHGDGRVVEEEKVYLGGVGAVVGGRAEGDDSADEGASHQEEDPRQAEHAVVPPDLGEVVSAAEADKEKGARDADEHPDGRVGVGGLLAEGAAVRVHGVVEVQVVKVKSGPGRVRRTETRTGTGLGDIEDRHKRTWHRLRVAQRGRRRCRIRGAGAGPRDDVSGALSVRRGRRDGRA